MCSPLNPNMDSFADTVDNLPSFFIGVRSLWGAPERILQAQLSGLKTSMFFSDLWPIEHRDFLLPGDSFRSGLGNSGDFWRIFWTTRSSKIDQWIGLRENLPETIDFPIIHMGLSWKFSPDPYHGEGSPSKETKSGCLVWEVIPDLIWFLTIRGKQF